MFIQFADIIVHIMFVSVPEAMFVVSLCLIISNRFDLLELKFDKVWKFFAPVLAVSLITIFLRSNIPESVNYIPVISVLILLVSIIFIYRINNSIEILKTALSLIFSYMVGVFIQLSYVPLLLYGTGMELYEIDAHGPMVIIWTIPERIIEITLVTYLLTKKRDAFGVNVLKEIIRSRTLTITAGIMIILNMAFMWVMVKLICFDYLLQGLSFAVQVTTIALVLAFPLLNMVCLCVVVYHIKRKESFEKLINGQRLRTLISVLDAYTNTGNYDKISLVLNDLKNHSNQLFNDTK